MKTIISKAAWFISCLLIVQVNLSLAQNALYEKTGLNFDGVNDYVQVSNGAVTVPGLAINNGTNYTMQAFVKFDAIAATGYRNIFYNGNSAANGWGLYTYNGKLSVIVGNKFQYNTTSFTPVTGKWYHLALKLNLARDLYGTYYGAYSVWVDGANITPVGPNGPSFYIITNAGLGGVLNSPAATDGIFIGGRAGAENLAATIDQVSIYQLDVDYNDANCLFSPALRAYTFEEGTANGNNVGKSVTDRSGNNKTGTLFNFSLTDPGGKSNYTNGVVSIGSNARLYVNKNATGSNTGESWENAMTNLSDALALSCSRTNQEIWIAEGTYKPDRDWYGANNGRKNTFYVKANLKIYGGFMGNETDLNKRMPGHNTILSGNLGDESTAEDNSFHVMFVRDGLNSVLLDGLVIQDGFASLNAKETLPTITVNGTNHADGAGIWSSGALTISNCVFANNKCIGTGGGIYMSPNGDILSCRQVVFTKNEANQGGGLYYQVSAPLELLNCTFFDNKGTLNGGAVARYFLGGTPNPLPALTITNCIFNSNLGTNPLAPVQTPNLTYSNIQIQAAVFAGTGVNNANPFFRNADSPIGFDGIWMTADDGLQINGCDVIDKGSNTAVAAIPLDILYFTRKFDVNAITDGGEGNGAKVDMGAYESNLTFTGPGKINVGSATIPYPPEEADTVRSVIDPGAFPNAVYSWQKDEKSGNGWQTIVLDNYTHYYPLDSLKKTTDFRRVTTICGNIYYSDTVSIKVIKPDGGFSGQVLSKNGFPVKGIEIQVKKKGNLPGSPAAFVYRDTTGDDGRYSISPIYYGDPDNTSATVFEIRPVKEGHVFNIGLLERTITPAFKTFTDVNFVDNTVFSISGSTLQQCNDCLLADNSIGVKNCPINDVEMRVNGGFQVKSTIIDAQEGRYSITITDPKQYIFSAKYKTRDFLPKDTSINVTKDITGLLFKDTTTRLITGRVAAGCGDNIGTTTLEFIDTGVVSCFRKTVVSDNLGNFSVRLPARAYRATIKDIVLKQGSTDNLPDVMNFFTAILPKDSLYRDITDRDTTLYIVYQRLPSMVIVDGFDPANECAPIESQFALIPQLTERPIRIKVYQGTEAQNCPATDTLLRIFTNIQVEDENEEMVYRTIKGDIKDTLTGGNPNIIWPHFKTFNPVFKDVFGREVSLTRKVVVTGVKANIGTYTTISPEVPLLVLHDPPGDRSKSFWSQNVANQTTLRMYVGKTQGAEAWSQIKIGTSFISGLGFAVPTKIWGSIGGTFGVSQKINTVNESTITTTTTQTYSTADEASFTGDNGDLFVGGALNLRYSAADELSFNPDSCKLFLRKTLAVGNEGFATTYNYTQSFIKNTLIPEQLANSINASLTPAQRDNFANSVKVWQQVLNNNEANKKRAKFESNKSFSAGSTNTFTSSSKTSKTSTIQFDMEINTQLALELGVDIAGAGFSGGTKVKMKMETGQSQTGVQTQETTTGYTLQDDDAGDNFSVDVKRDPVYNTPVFDLVAGTSSCPTEAGTRPRGEMQLTVEAPTKSGIAPDGEALFYVKLGNTSQSNEARTYRLSFVQASNPNGAIITIGGSPILTGIDYNIAYLSEVQVAVSIKKNAASNVFSYEGLEFVLSDPCGGNISKTVKLSAYFNSPCSPITLVSPQNDWVANSQLNDKLAIAFKDYVPQNLQTVALEYTSKGSNSWITALSFNSNQLPNSANGAQVDWNIKNVPDGSYELRLKLVCATGTIYTERVSGVIDRKAPNLFGKTDPSDDEYVVGDLIGVKYNEKIDVSKLKPTDVQLIRGSNNEMIPVTATAYDNQIVLVPVAPISGFSKERMVVKLLNVADVYGNKLATPDSFSFVIGTTLVATGNSALNVAVRNANIPENAGAAIIKAGLQPNVLGAIDTTITVVFELPANTPVPMLINFAVGGTAVYLTDYLVSFDSVATSNKNTFDGAVGSLVMAGNTKKAVLRIDPVNNGGFSIDKTIIVSVLEGGDYGIGNTPTVSGKILNDEPGLFIFTGDGNFDVPSYWIGSKVPPGLVPAGMEIVINPDGEGSCILTTPLTIQTGGKLTVMPGKKLVVKGNLIHQNQ